MNRLNVFALITCQFSFLFEGSILSFNMIQELNLDSFILTAYLAGHMPSEWVQLVSNISFDMCKIPKAALKCVILLLYVLFFCKSTNLMALSLNRIQIFFFIIMKCRDGEQWVIDQWRFSFFFCLNLLTAIRAKIALNLKINNNNLFRIHTSNAFNWNLRITCESTIRF